MVERPCEADFVIRGAGLDRPAAGLLCPGAAGDDGGSDDRAALRMSPIGLAFTI